jgi:hypothetical protein
MERDLTEEDCNYDYETWIDSCHYTFLNDSLSDVENVSDEEHEIASRFLTTIGLRNEDSEEIVIILTPIEMFNLIVQLQRQIGSENHISKR